MPRESASRSEPITTNSSRTTPRCTILPTAVIVCGVVVFVVVVAVAGTRAELLPLCSRAQFRTHLDPPSRHLVCDHAIITLASRESSESVGPIGLIGLIGLCERQHDKDTRTSGRPLTLEGGEGRQHPTRERCGTLAQVARDVTGKAKYGDCTSQAHASWEER